MNRRKSNIVNPSKLVFQPINKNDLQLIQIALICSFLALTIEISFLGSARSQALNEQSVNCCLLEFLVTSSIAPSVQFVIPKLTSQLFHSLQVLLPEEDKSSIRLQNCSPDFLIQYLRKFNFFFRYYYINKYPNDLTKLSYKRINMLGVKTLILIHGM